VQGTLDNNVRWNRGPYKTLISIFVDEDATDNPEELGLSIPLDDLENH
jgi:hypothetical protein